MRALTRCSWNHDERVWGLTRHTAEQPEFQRVHVQVMTAITRKDALRLQAQNLALGDTLRTRWVLDEVATQPVALRCVTPVVDLHTHVLETLYDRWSMDVGVIISGDTEVRYAQQSLLQCTCKARVAHAGLPKGVCPADIVP